MTRKLIYRPEALAGLNDAERYTIRTWGKAQAKLYVATLVSDIKALRKTGQRYPSIDDAYPGLRRRRSELHHIYYVISQDRVEVLNIIHLSRDPARHLKVEGWHDLEVKG